MAERSIILNTAEEIDDVTVGGGSALSGTQVLIVVWRDEVSVSEIMSELRRAEAAMMQRFRG